MSFIAKNLTYESRDPSFLRKLKGEFGTTDAVRQQRPQARPKRLRNTQEDDDDLPIYVNDQDPSEILSKAEYDALLEAPSTEQQPLKEAPPDVDRQTSKATGARPTSSAGVRTEHESAVKERSAGIGGCSKKRAAKIVGDDALSDEAQNSMSEAHVVKKSAPKRAKKMKLSFEDD
ncbi:MAG: hypothetical protein LQ337_000340 [Flavoplaca oasis]|nr:MAG: hypothetical protein LQ337_000340 [Flavoplaca oasis]